MPETRQMMLNSPDLWLTVWRDVHESLPFEVLEALANKAPITVALVTPATYRVVRDMPVFAHRGPGEFDPEGDAVQWLGEIYGMRVGVLNILPAIGGPA